MAEDTEILLLGGIPDPSRSWPLDAFALGDRLCLASVGTSVFEVTDLAKGQVDGLLQMTLTGPGAEHVRLSTPRDTPAVAVRMVRALSATCMLCDAPTTVAVDVAGTKAAQILRFLCKSH